MLARGAVRTVPRARVRALLIHLGFHLWFHLWLHKAAPQHSIPRGRRLNLGLVHASSNAGGPIGRPFHSRRHARDIMSSLLLLGSTGSIGTQTIELLREQPGRHRVVGLAARASWELLVEQARE